MLLDAQAIDNPHHGRTKRTRISLWCIVPKPSVLCGDFGAIGTHVLESSLYRVALVAKAQELVGVHLRLLGARPLLLGFFAREDLIHFRSLTGVFRLVLASHSHVTLRNAQPERLDPGHNPRRQQPTKRHVARGIHERQEKCRHDISRPPRTNF